MSKTNLPAALNDPRLSRRETDFFTKTWGEAFDNYGVMPNPDIPDINKDHFLKYLSRISKRLKEHESSAAAIAELPAPRPDSKTSLRPEDNFPMLMSRKIGL
jgi:vacuolar protein sorting-associated protein 54